MLVVMSVGATEEEVQDVRRHIEADGLTPHGSRGEQRVVIGSCDCPYPLDENYFLISYDPNGTGAADNRAAKKVAIYLARVS